MPALNSLGSDRREDGTGGARESMGSKGWHARHPLTSPFGALHYLPGIHPGWIVDDGAEIREGGSQGEYE